MEMAQMEGSAGEDVTGENVSIALFLHMHRICVDNARSCPRVQTSTGQRSMKHSATCPRRQQLVTEQFHEACRTLNVSTLSDRRVEQCKTSFKQITN